jgi:predicted RecA/RadA family phage recombinase
LPAPSGGTVAGMFYLIGGVFACAASTVAAGVSCVFHLCGAYDTAPKATGAAWTAGDVLYWDNTNKVFTKTSSGNKQVAVADADALSGDAVGSINLGIFAI